MSGYGFHWTPCKPSGGGGGLALVAVAVVVGVIYEALKAIWHTLVLTVEIIAGITLGVVGAAAIAGAVLVGLRIRRELLAGRPQLGDQAPAVIRAEVITDAAEAARPNVQRQTRGAIQGKRTGTVLSGNVIRGPFGERERAPRDGEGA